MNILVLCPMHSEYLNFKNALKSENLSHNYNVVELGVGKANAAANTALSVYNPNLQYRYDLAVVIGYAAASPLYHQGDIILPSSARYHDVSVPDGLVPELTNLYQLQGDDDCTILTGDSFVDSTLSESLQSLYTDKVLFDMESASVAQILQDTEIPLLVMKMVSDIPGTDNYQSFSEFVESHSDFSSFVYFLESL